MLYQRIPGLWLIPCKGRTRCGRSGKVWRSIVHGFAAKLGSLSANDALSHAPGYSPMA